jgi:molybdopterin-binding protein
MSIELKNISKKFSDFELKNINFKVEKGEYFALLGRSGAGKSLILEIISGFKKPDSGKVFINEIDITEKKIQDRKVGVVFQDLAIFPHKTVWQNIEFPIIKKPKIEKNQIIERLANELNIFHLLDKKPGTLSGGEKQRIAIARTLAANPEVLLLDEPLSALDVQLKAETTDLLRLLSKKGITIIHITHDFNEALQLAEKVAIMNKGKLLQSGNIRDVFSKPNSKFAANFAGIDNFFDAELTSNKQTNSKIAFVDNKIYFSIVTDENNCHGYIIIKNENILLLPEYAESSAANNFEGKIINILPERSGVKVVVDIGIRITALITENSLTRLHLEESKTVWVSIKATAITFIKH